MTTGPTNEQETTSADYALAPEVVIDIEDSSLPLSEVEDFIAEYTNVFAAPVTVRSHWGGPAASGLGVEIAVAIVVGELLRQVGSDAYNVAKQYISSLYHKINPQSAARTYNTAFLALVVEPEDDGDAPVLNFCFPPGLTDDEILARWHSIEQNWRRLSTEWTERLRERVGDEGPRFDIDLDLDEESGEWREYV